ncbi:MAG: 1-acyl-sn-glycerol-3-phosphate acyltransferase [Candidatus Sericytochromatia bacterium]|nr:MAG: 1-acyl-sn-glycerol-3-phosphate acyltransferase [Candidatus Sericytochromatia bacterium]
MVYINIFFKIEIEGRENLDYNRTYIVISNHASYIDPPLLGISIPRPIAYMAKEEIFKVPILRTIVRFNGAFSVNRKKKDSSFIKNTIYALKNGWLVAIFPEGTRSVDGKLLKMRSGVARILLEEPFPILPVALINTHKAFPKKGKIKLFSKIKVRIGKIVEVNEYMPPDNLTYEEKIEYLKNFLW